MSESAYDRLLIWLAWLAPLSLVALNGWQYSLIGWYANLDAPASITFGARFQEDISAWLKGSDQRGARLYLIVDRTCPCTKATLQLVQDSLSRSSRTDIQFAALDVGNAGLATDAAWNNLLRDIPATPTLLAIDGGRLVYAGPAASGSFCSGKTGRLPGLTALQASPLQPILNSVSTGCYCKLNGV